jgi:hypothetical protein
MKTKISVCCLLPLSGLLLALTAARGADSPPAAATPATKTGEPKTYNLFMGADVDVQVKKDYCAVRDVAGDSFVITAGGKEVTVPMDSGPISLQVRNSLKLTEVAATVSQLKGERAYTPENDPFRKFARTQPGSNARDVVARADGAAMILSNLAAAGGTARGSGPGPGGMPVSSGEVKAAQLAAENAGTAMFAEGNSVGTYAAMMQAEYDKQLFDAMEVEFEVSSEKALTHPYVVIIARYRESDSKQAKSRSWIFAKALQPIDQTPRKVHLKQGGFPPGFVMEDFKVHLYNRGQELATNVADRRVELTRDEACQYLILEHIASHRDADAPAAPLLGRLPADLPARLQQGQFGATYYVKVGKDGLPVDAFVDASCDKKVEDPYLQAVIKDLRFKPMLEKGRPVEGVALLKLSELR